MRLRRIAVLVACALAPINLFGCGDVDVVTASYANLQEAREAGAISRGWMPEGLPPGAHDIREAHGVDTNRRWALFSFPPAERPVLERLLERGETSLMGEVCDVPGRLEWWPVLLRGTLDDEQIRSAGLRAYRAADGNLLFAVNWKQGRAYYWTPPSGDRP